MKTESAPGIAYKGFNPGYECRGFKYQIGKTYTVGGDIKLCNKGFHACEYPLAVFDFYPPAGSVYGTVEQSGTLVDDETKQASSSITVKASLSLQGLISAAIEYTFSRSKPSNADRATGYQGAASSTGYQGAASSTGDRGAASSTGYQGAASSTGIRGAASSTGYQGAASNGGKDGVATALGYDSKAKSCLGGIIVVAWYDANSERKRVTVGYPGEKGIKADTWYTADAAGELVEVP